MSSQLFWYVENNNYEELKQYIEKGKNLNVLTPAAGTPGPGHFEDAEHVRAYVLDWAFDYDRKDMIILLLKNGAESVYSLLHNAAVYDDIEVLELILKLYPHIVEKTFEKSPVWDSLYNGHEDAAVWLIAHGADYKNFESYTATATASGLFLAPMHLAAIKGMAKVVEAILQKQKKYVEYIDSTGRSPLHYAVQHSFTKIVNILIDARADVNVENLDGNTPLHFAHDRDNTIALLHSGACIDIHNKLGETPLVVASQLGAIDVVEELVKAGANIYKKDKDGNSLIHQALLGRYHANKEKEIELYVSAGLDIDNKNDQGETPLQIAVLKLKYRMVIFLLNRNADVHIKDQFGKTLLHRVAETHSTSEECIKIITLLKEQGIQLNAKDDYNKTAYDVYIEKKGSLSFNFEKVSKLLEN